MDLFKNIVEEEKLHQNYKAFKYDKLPYTREVLSNWSTGFEDRDNKFIYEFQSTFNSSFWELYLFSVLKELKYSVDFTHNRPDFLVSREDLELNIEATIASHSENGQPEWERTYSEKELEKWSQEKILYNSTLRLANAFKSKSNKFLKSYSKLNYVKNKPFVLAIAPFDSPYFFEANQQAIRRILYGFDRYKAVDYSESQREILETINMHSINKINQKLEEVDIKLGFFNNDEFKHISAVIFSNVATASKVRMLSDDPQVIVTNETRFNPYSTQPYNNILGKREANEHLLDGLSILHNPFADFPLDREAFEHPLVAQIDSMDFEDGVPENFLFKRVIFVSKGSQKLTKKRKNEHERAIKSMFEKEVKYPIYHN
ncbi:hypothetical protein EH196_19405 [Bacillus sp. C1-1]|nr:hypothetical protein EH196_19405 [Bacillus sp. C1-1]